MTAGLRRRSATPRRDRGEEKDDRQDELRGVGDAGAGAGQGEDDRLWDVAEQGGEEERDGGDAGHAGQEVQQQVVAEREQAEGERRGEGALGEEAVPAMEPAALPALEEAGGGAAAEQAGPGEVEGAAGEFGEQRERGAGPEAEGVAAGQRHGLAWDAGGAGEGGEEDVAERALAAGGVGGAAQVEACARAGRIQAQPGRPASAPGARRSGAGRSQRPGLGPAPAAEHQGSRRLTGACCIGARVASRQLRSQVRQRQEYSKRGIAARGSQVRRFGVCEGLTNFGESVS